MEDATSRREELARKLASDLAWFGIWEAYLPTADWIISHYEKPECLCNVGVQFCPVHPNRLLTQEEKIAFRKLWDLSVEKGKKS